MEVVIAKTQVEVAKRCADICCTLIKKKPNAVLGLATGTTPLPVYKELIQRHRADEVSFRQVTTFNLDEYLGLAPDHPRSYRTFMNENFFEHIDIDIENTNLPDGNAENPLKAGPEYEERLREAGGIDLQILGIGTNGHIGFNEPTSSLGSRTRLKTLTEITVRDNKRFFKSEEFQPRLVITMGIKTILEAKRILLLATGSRKAQAIADAVEGPLSAMCPASSLQMHPNVSVIVDNAAAAKLQLKEYYLWVLSHQDYLLERFGDPR